MAYASSFHTRDMDIFGGLEDCKGDDQTNPLSQDNKATIVQLVISLALGVSSFIAFCILRPRWKSLYAARKRQTDAASSLPELPDTLFGWIPVLYKITEQEVLAAAGLDAYVFLSFFKMSIKFLTITFLLSATIMAPINAKFVGIPGLGDDLPSNGTSSLGAAHAYQTDGKGHKKKKFEADTSYLWSYLAFTYAFTALALYFLVSETKKIIRVRQDYLGSQSTITDRTIRLSGIPPELRSEEEISTIIEKLQIGKVESVILCRQWREIDILMDKRPYILRQLERAWAALLANKDVKRNTGHSHVSEDGRSYEEDSEEDANEGEHDNLIRESNNRRTTSEKPRPTKRIWFGFLKLRSRKVDAIDYYEENLRKVDEKIKDTRKKEYRPTALAFVTMDSIPACQMAVQALIDPRPMRLSASLAPAPSDIVWSNTHLSRSSRMVRSWSISTFVTILSVVWLIIIAPFATLLNLCSVKKVSPELGDFLGRHQITMALVQTGLPTLVVSLLNIAVPYLYDYLSNMQGMISQSEVELSVISKNFFFTFFNVFFVVAAFGTASNIWGDIQDSLRDTTKLAYRLAKSVEALGLFYTNFILLQGIGLFPLRLLEFGSVFMYPVYKMLAKTPRDYAELEQPPIFKYGFYLPTSILVLILCIVYSILPPGYQVLFFGLIYFVIGYFTYKYQLLYAMDHPQHATGGGWTMICYRIMLGLGVFQLAMAGVIALKEEFTPAALVLPLIGFTIWFSYFYGWTYEPLTKYIALRSIRREDDPDYNIADEDIGIAQPPGHIRRLSSTVDEERERGQKYVNPNLVVPLEKIWVNQMSSRNGDDGTPLPEIVHEESAGSSMSLGDTHVWRENGDDNVKEYPISLDITSSHILLSRGVAASDKKPQDITIPTAAPLTPITTIFESQNYHITSFGAPELLSPIRYIAPNPTAGSLSNQIEVGVLDNAPSCKETQGESKTSPLISKIGLASMEQPLRNPVDRLANNPPPDGARDLLSNRAVSSSTWPPRRNEVASGLERGRSVQRTVRLSNPLEGAESRHRMSDATVEVDVQGIQTRHCRSVAFVETPKDPCVAFEDHVLEPCRHDPICNSVSEMMARPVRNIQSGVDTPSPVAGFVRTNSNKFHDISRMSTCSKKSSLMDIKALYSIPTLMAEIVSEFSPKLNHVEGMSLMTSSEVWCSTTDSEQRLSATSLLPAEILWQIYDNLSPADFNSARHACRLWYINSLERSLLETMLKRGGWSTGIYNELPSNQILDSQARVNHEWLLSKRIARECALGPDWTGNGLCPANESLKCLYTKHDLRRTSFVQTTTTDFTEIGVHYPGADEATSGISFTVSTCGEFLMVAHGCLVYIYELNYNQGCGDSIEDRQNGILRPVTSVICPRRVLACSMDTSSHRYAIAVLLDDRMGLVCDLISLKDRNHRLSMSRCRMNQEASLSRGSEYRNRVSISSSQSRSPPRAQTDQLFVFPIIAAEASQSNFSTESEFNVWEDVLQSRIPPHGMSSADQSRTTHHPLFGQTEFQGHAANSFPPCPMPVETSIPTLYAPLCSADDMPRSVALCPQRRCVAFGCSSGIELHWVDALTGQDLNRWFPLTAPSDYLYFLPPRPGVDSAKKLRLISSAGRPGENSVIAERYGVIKSGSHASPFWRFHPGRHGTDLSDVVAASRVGSSTPSRDNSDHYRAVPLSDGYHILFTDPATDLLCLGSDAPIGGPTKLLRKIWFAGPQGQGSPVTYIGGSDLRWGVRVVAAYGQGIEQSIWLFSVPPDVFTEIQGEHGGVNLPFAGITSGIENGNRDWVKWWCNIDSTNAPEPTYGASHAMIIRHDRLWPIQVRGQEIGKCNAVVDLAIDAGPEMRIWAFSKEGMVKTWQIDSASLDATACRRVLIMRDGTIRRTDAEGDTQMADVPLPFDQSLPGRGTSDHETFDGSTSMTSSQSLSGQSLWKCKGSGSQNSVNVDADGDVLMTDLPSPESPVYENWSAELFESVALTQNGREVLIHPDRYSGPAYVERTEVSCQDLVDVLTGIARIDIEIR